MSSIRRLMRSSRRRLAKGAGPSECVDDKSRFFVAATMVAASMLFGIDGSMVNVALPAIKTALAVSDEHLSWLVSGHMLAYVAVAPCIRWCCSRFGRREIFCFSLAVLTLVSPLCSIATSIEQLIALRVVQGLAVGVIYPLTLAILLDEYPPADHAKVVTWWTTGGFVGPLLGTSLSGVLIHFFRWPGIFVCETAICLCLLIGSIRSIRASPPSSDESLDVIGLVTAVPAIVALQVILIRGLSRLASPVSLAAIAAFFVCGAIFAANLRRMKHPLVNFRLFTDGNFSSAVVLSVLMGFEIFSLGFLIPLLLTETIGADVLQVTLLVLPRLIGTAIGSMAGGRMAKALGLNVLTCGGFALVGVGSLVLFSALFSGNVPSIVVASTLHGLGVGVGSVVLGIRSFTTLPARWRDEGSALRSLLRMVGGSAGIAIVVSVLGASSPTWHAGYPGALLLTTIVALIGVVAVPLLSLGASNDVGRRHDSALPD